MIGPDSEFQNAARGAAGRQSRIGPIEKIAGEIFMAMIGHLRIELTNASPAPHDDHVAVCAYSAARLFKFLRALLSI
jgi:hypothetical protein